MLSLALIGAMAAHHTFALRHSEFLLDGEPFQIIAGEMHPARIPVEYWRHRIQMAKAMGCNTVSLYVFWNHHETSEGKFDFKTDNHDLGKFLKTCQEEGVWVLLRPGPYCCAEWDFGGLPPYLLKYPDIKVRCMDDRYLKAAGRYIDRLSQIVKPMLVTHGGPVLMVQIENEYGSFGNDREYMSWVKNRWVRDDIDVPFYTGDGPTTYMLEAGSLPHCAVGLDSGSSQADWDLANKMNPGVPVFSSETYPGWLTHWGEKWARADTSGVVNEVKWLLDNKKSFSLYVVHGGTNFGFTAGANSGGKGYEPDVTSYDYDAPISEQGIATDKYMALRTLIGQYRQNKPLPAVPAPVPTMSTPVVAMRPLLSIWDRLGTPIKTAQPQPFEALGQYQGFAVYETELIGHKSGQLTVHDLHDYATVFLDGKYVGKMDRREGSMSIDLPQMDSKTPKLQILVEAMGRINFAQNMIDRKGITDRVTLNGMTLMNWKTYQLPMVEMNVDPTNPSKMSDPMRPGQIFYGEFMLDKVADTFFDTSEFVKGVAWVNGHNLGRYWNIGPQSKLYCPASWLRSGKNTVTFFDLHQTASAHTQGLQTPE